MAFTGDPVKTGAGLIYVAAIGTTEPTTASAALPSAFRPVGYTEEGIEISYKLDNNPIEVAEELDPIRYETKSREGSIKIALAEITGKNLALALNSGANVTTGGSIEPPNPGSEVRVMFVLDTAGSPASPNSAPGATNARWIFRQCIQSEEITMARKKTPDKALITVNFRLEKPSGLAPFKAFEDANGNV